MTPSCEESKLHKHIGWYIQITDHTVMVRNIPSLSSASTTVFQNINIIEVVKCVDIHHTNHNRQNSTKKDSDIPDIFTTGDHTPFLTRSLSITVLQNHREYMYRNQWQVSNTIIIIYYYVGCLSYLQHYKHRRVL